MQHSTGTPTTSELDRIVRSKQGPCMACTVLLSLGLLHAKQVVIGCDYNHAKSGNIRRGHVFGYALCVWHHRGHPLNSWDVRWTRGIYGPSLMDGSAKFHATYGTDDELIELQTEWLSRGVEQ